MSLRPNEPLLFASHLGDWVEEHHASPRPEGSHKPTKAPRLGHVELMGFMEAGYNEEVGAKLASLAADASIDAIILWVDSGGGYYDGTPELAERVRRAASLKPLYAVVIGYCCSGAYWVASQATRIIATPSATIGSLNAYVVVLDSHEAFRRQGVKVIRIAGEGGVLKGHPMPGVEVPDEFIAMIQNRCDYIALKFILAVMRGRKLSEDEAQRVASGEIWYAEMAKTKKLVDEVALPEDVITNILPKLQPQKPEQFTKLKGVEAEEKVEEIAQSRFGVDIEDLEPEHFAKLRAEFPKLLSAAKANADHRLRNGPGRSCYP